MAGDGAEAIELIEKHKPDILLIDVIMPEYDGIHVVNHVSRYMGEYNPYSYMLSNLTSDFSVKILNSIEVDYISDKDIGTDVIIENLNKVLHYNNLSHRHSSNKHWLHHGAGPVYQTANTIEKHLALPAGCFVWHNQYPVSERDIDVRITWYG